MELAPVSLRKLPLQKKKSRLHSYYMNSSITSFSIRINCFSLLFIGFMTPLELEMFLSVPNVEFNTYWIPCTWFICLLKDAKKNKMLINDMQGLKLIMEVI